MPDNKLTSTAKDSVKLGILSMGGMSALGAMQNVPGMPAEASNVVGIAGSGLALANVGQLAKTGMVVADSLTGQQSMKQPTQPVKKPVQKTQSTNKNSVVNRILYG